MSSIAIAIGPSRRLSPISIRHRHPLHVAIQNWEHDFNIGSMVRTANAFNVGGVHIIGRRRWNRRGAMVTDRYLTVHHHATVAEFADWLSAEAYAAVGVDNLRRRRAAGDDRAARAGLPGLRLGGSRAHRRTGRLSASSWWPSPSTVRPARSTPARPRRSRCITGRSAGPGDIATPSNPGCRPAASVRILVFTGLVADTVVRARRSIDAQYRPQRGLGPAHWIVRSRPPPPSALRSAPSWSS